MNMQDLRKDDESLSSSVTALSFSCILCSQFKPPYFANGNVLLAILCWKAVISLPPCNGIRIAHANDVA